MAALEAPAEEDTAGGSLTDSALVLDIVPLAYVLMVGAAIALVVNFPNVKEQANQLVAHGKSIVAVVSMVMAAGVLTGVLNGTGMVDAMAAWLVDIIPDSMGRPIMAIVTGLLSIPMTLLVMLAVGILPGAIPWG